METNKISAQTVKEYVSLFLADPFFIKFKNEDYFNKVKEFKTKNNLDDSAKLLRPNFEDELSYLNFLIVNFLNSKFNKDTLWIASWKQLLHVLKSNKTCNNAMYFYLLLNPCNNKISADIKEKSITELLKLLLDKKIVYELFNSDFLRLWKESRETETYSVKIQELLQQVLLLPFQDDNLIFNLSRIDLKLYFVLDQANGSFIKTWMTGLIKQFSVFLKNAEKVDFYTNNQLRTLDNNLNYLKKQLQKTAHKKILLEFANLDTEHASLIKTFQDLVHKVVLWLKRLQQKKTTMLVKQEVVSNEAKLLSNFKEDSLIVRIKKDFTFFANLLFLNINELMQNENTARNFLKETFENKSLFDLMNQEEMVKTLFLKMMKHFQEYQNNDLIQELKKQLGKQCFSFSFEKNYKETLSSRSAYLMNLDLYPEIECLIFKIQQNKKIMNCKVSENNVKMLTSLNCIFNYLKQQNSALSLQTLLVFKLFYFIYYQNEGFNLRNISMHRSYAGYIELKPEYNLAINNLIIATLLYLVDFYSSL